MEHDLARRDLRTWSLWPIFMIAGVIALGMITVGTQFRPIADDYIHIGRVAEMGILSSTTDWFSTFLPGFFGVLLISLFTSLFGSVPDSFAYVPYTLFLVIVLYLVGLTLIFPLTQRLRTATPWLFALTIPSLWLLSMGNIFPQYDIINTFGMLSWISNGYRAHLPLLILIFFFWMNWWRSSAVTGTLIGFLGMLFLTLNFLNALPDIAAYFALALGSALFYAWRYRMQPGRTNSRLIAVNAGMAGGALVGLAILLLSPGTTSRTDAIPIQFSLPAALQVIPYQVAIFLREMMNISHAIVLIAAISLGALLTQMSRTTVEAGGLSRLRLMSLQAVFLTLLVLGTGVVGETLTYAAIFHRWVVLQVEFVSIVLIGLWAGAAMTIRYPSWIGRRWVSVVLALALMTAVIPLTNIVEFSVERKRVWETGRPAPVSYMPDREQPMLQEWWAVIEQGRTAGG